MSGVALAFVDLTAVGRLADEDLLVTGRAEHAGLWRTAVGVTHALVSWTTGAWVFDNGEFATEARWRSDAWAGETIARAFVSAAAASLVDHAQRVSGACASRS